MMVITHNNDYEQGIFVALENGRRMGYLSYEWADPDRFAILHTVVEEEFQGKGVAKALLDAAADYARKEGKKIWPVCPYVVAQFRKNREYDDVK